MSDLCALSAREIARRVAAGELKARAVAEAHLARIDALDPKLKVFLEVWRDDALAAADAVDAAVADGEPAGPLAGVPVALKDNLCAAGRRTTCSSKILENYVSPYDAHVVELLRAAGAVLVGKTNLDEFAMGSSTENSAFFTTRNPWDPARVPGGSSGGSAVAVAAGMAALALGSDTGGSIRQPASLCGVVGLKPTYGRVSRYGLVAFASSLDQIGPFARSVEDAALLLGVIAGHDARDSTCSREPVPDYLAGLGAGLEGLRVGLPKEYFIDGLDPEVECRVRESVELLQKAGAEVREVSLPHTKYAVSTYYLIAPSEASSNLARYDGIRYGLSRQDDGASLLEVYTKSRGAGFGPEVKRRIVLGTYALSAGYYDAYYGKAQKLRTLFIRDFQKAFGECDVILSPTAPTTAFKIGEKSADPLQMYLNDVFTIPCNLAGIAGISVPAGLSGSGLPIGVQLLGKTFDEPTLLRAAAAFERLRPWKVPALAAEAAA